MNFTLRDFNIIHKYNFIRHLFKTCVHCGIYFWEYICRVRKECDLQALTGFNMGGFSPRRQKYFVLNAIQKMRYLILIYIKMNLFVFIV